MSKLTHLGIGTQKKTHPLRATVVVAGQRPSAELAHSLTALFASSDTRMDWNCICKACYSQSDFILGFGISICSLIHQQVTRNKDHEFQLEHALTIFNMFLLIYDLYDIPVG